VSFKGRIYSFWIIAEFPSGLSKPPDGGCLLKV